MAGIGQPGNIQKRRMWLCSILPALAILYCVSLVTAAPSFGNLAVTKADRQIDLTGGVCRDTLSLKVLNEGGADEELIYLAFSEPQAHHLSYLKVWLPDGKKKAGIELKTEVLTADIAGASKTTCYSARLPSPLKPQQTISVEAVAIFTQVFTPYPAEIQQSEQQLLLFEDSAYILSPYPVKSQTTKVKVPSKSLVSHTQVPPTSKTDKEVKYGPYENLQPFTSSAITVHFESNRPLVVASQLIKGYEISHWGNVFVLEEYKLTHVGARHAGQFSRLELQTRPHQSALSALKQMKAILPPRARSVYYRDEIGNISTSHLRESFSKTELEFEPRYPLVGGWQTSFTLGYSLPLKDYLYAADDRRLLNLTLASPIQDLIIDELIVKIVLPEGSTDIGTQVPFVMEEGREVKYTYLDTVGRPVVVLRKYNVVPEHNVHFQVLYTFSTAKMFVEPLLLVAVCLSFFVASMIYVRLDFTIAKSSSAYQARLQQEQAADVVQKLQKVVKFRGMLLEKLEESLRALGKNDDVVAAKNQRKIIETGLKDSAKDMKAATDILEAAAHHAPLLMKVTALVTKEREMVDKTLQKHTQVLDVYGKVSAKEIDSRVSSIQERITELRMEVQSLVASLE